MIAISASGARAGVHHAWANLGQAPARMLAIFLPGGIETLFARRLAAGKVS